MPNDIHRAPESAESYITRLWAKEGTRIMLLALGTLLGFSVNNVLRNIDTLATSQAKSNETMTRVESDVRNITTRLDEGVIKQVAEQKEMLRKHDERLQQLERRVRLP